MKRIFSWDNLPEFLRNERLRGITIFIGVLSLVGLWLAFIYSWILGVIGVFAVLLGLIFSFNTMSEIGKDTNRYISDLSYRIKHGEQEALIEMPVGIVIFSKSDELWRSNRTG